VLACVPQDEAHRITSEQFEFTCGNVFFPKLNHLYPAAGGFGDLFQQMYAALGL
jgi:hypothetical protein